MTVCSRCVMDTSDPDIVFDSEGVCNHCHAFDDIQKYWEARKKSLPLIVEAIKKDGRNKKYDCIAAISGGVDSSFMTYKVHELGLRPLAVHFENHWDSLIAVNNISNLLTRLDIPLKTYTLDWEEIKDIQLAFLRSSTPDVDVASDHAIHALLWEAVKDAGVNYVFSGMNYRTETHGVRAWSQGHRDWKYIKSIHDQYGTVPLKTFPHFQPWTFLYKSVLKKPHIIPLLNYIDYVKKDAMHLLNTNFGFTPYSGKHGENLYTRFIQGYILPTKFGFDKRKPHLSSLICAGELIRAEALDELAILPYSEADFEADKQIFLSKLGLSEDELNQLMQLPPCSYYDFPHSLFFDNSRMALLRKLWRRYFK